MKEKRQTFDDMTRKGTGGCFSVKTNGVVTHVVVIGGYNNLPPNIGPLSTTEILNVETLTWSNGPSLPSPMTDFGAVESFEVPYLGFVIGGTTNSNYAPILGLQKINGDIGETLQWDFVRSTDNGRYGHTVVNAPLSMLPSC